MGYKLMHDDIDKGLLTYIADHLPDGTAIFYISRRHWMEIVPEAIQSALMALTVIAVGLQFRSPHNPAYYWPLVALIAIIAIIHPFGLECWRWASDVYVVFESGWGRRHFSFRHMAFRPKFQALVTTTTVEKTAFAGIGGFDIGKIVVRDAAGEITMTPLLPNPYAVQSRLIEAGQYRSGELPPMANDPWRL